MFKYVLKRIGWGIVTLFLIISATFFLVAGAPGDPIASKVGQMPEKAQAIIRAKYGLDKPTFVRYCIYMKNLITKGDFGESIIYTGQRANDIIAKNAPQTAKVAIIALIIQVFLGVILGIIAAINRQRIADHVIRVCVVLLICIPSFVFAALLQYFVAYKWKLAPIWGWGEFKHMILPIIAFSIGGVASYCKYMRSSVLNVLNEDYVLTARSKGCDKGQIIRRHVLRNSLIPIVTMVVPAIAGIFGGSFIIEGMFGIPGIGKYFVKSVSDMDYTMVIGLTAFFAMLYVVSLIMVDIVYGLVDPRIRITNKKR
ncbi:MAG: ABC transporter permease [Oscillospiraceae bacterium]